MLKRFKIKFNLWLDRRIPADSSITLAHRQTFVLPTRFGYMMLFILILMIIAATNYQNSMAFLLAFTLSALGFNIILQTYQNLTGLHIRSQSSEPIYAGQFLEIPLIVSTTDDRQYYSVGFGTREEVQQLVDIESATECEVNIKVLPEDRGWYNPGRLYCATVYPMGLLRVWSWFQLNQQYLVYPHPIEPEYYDDLNSDPNQQESGTLAAGNEDFSGLREYRKGDPMRKIHWRSYAREQGLYTMQFEQPQGKSTEFDFDAFHGIDTELRLSYLCHLVLEAERAGERFGLKLPAVIIAIDSGNNHLKKCLQALALFESSMTDGVRTDSVGHN